jgi:uncharacterized protein YaaQ
MPTVTRIIPRQEKSGTKGTPTIIKWKGVPMVASHSIRTVAKEIINMSENQDFVSINCIGKQGTGKTELMKTLAHLIHSGAKIPYNINYFGKNEMINLEETVKSLTPTNQIILMDDIAFLKASATNKQIDQIQQVLSVIRHLPSGEDVKIILFKSFQYTKAISPFLRQNDATFVSSVDDNEVSNLEDLLGKKYTLKINTLKNMRVQAKIGDNDKATFVYPLGIKGHSLTYKARNPFLPFLYSNQISCRIVVSPLRSWIDPICHVCEPIHKSVESKTNLSEFMEDFTKKFGGEANAKAAVKIKLIQNGINCYSPRITQAVRYIERFLAKKLINLEELAVAFDLSPTKTILMPQKQPEVEKND